jgi:hypothetical protein
VRAEIHGSRRRESWFFKAIYKTGKLLARWTKTKNREKRQISVNERGNSASLTSQAEKRVLQIILHSKVNY